MTGEMPAVVIVIVNWNTVESLTSCLSLLVEEGLDAQCDVVVVDNGSTDGSAEMVRSRFPTVRCLASGVNLGFGAAVNRAVEQTESEFVLVLNADVRIDGRAMQALLQAAREHPDAGAVGPQLRNWDGSPQYSYSASYPEDTIIRSRVLADGCVECAWVIGACMLLRRKALDKANGFDERFFLYYEDIDICRQMTKAGWAVVYAPWAEVIHELSRSAAQLPSQTTIRLRLDSLLLYLHKHYPARYERLRRSLMRRAWRGVVFHGVARRLPTRASAHHRQRWLMYRVWCEHFFGHSSVLRSLLALWGRMPPIPEDPIQRGAGHGAARQEPSPGRDT